MANAPTEPVEANPETASSTRIRSDLRQEQLIDIAIRLFARKGYEGTSLRDIADEARITKAALYYHFPNKEELYERIVLESMQNLVDTVSAAMRAGATPAERVRLFMRASADFLDRSRDSWIAGSNAFWSNSDARPRAVTVELRDTYERLLRESIRDAINQGQFRPVDPAMAGRMLLSMLNHLCRWHSLGGRLSTREVIDQYLDMTFSGLNAPSGH
ncbi:MAG: TetR family transcriptional regulator [Proteobacteria bacterium]|nr:TetR family transcriptional regulator [Pseudomonadota bacterium]